MAVPEGLHRQILPIQFTDAEIKRLLQNATADAASIMSSASSLRSAQIQLAKMNVELWANVESAVKVGIGDAVWNAKEMGALFDEKLFEAAGMSSTYWRASMMETAKQGVDSLISRKQNGITLSSKVYKGEALSKGLVSDAINNGLLLGKSAREIAKDVTKFINPDVPGGVSYAAMRLGRSEVQNAFHTTNLNDYKEKPWIEKVRWFLSGSHSRPDQCNEYASAQNFASGPAGIYWPDDVPGKPHPNCLCYIEPVMMDLDKYVKQFKQGKFDSYIEDQMGCYRGA